MKGGLGDIQWEALKAALNWHGTDIELEEELRAIIQEKRTYYPVFCAWCRADGLLNRVGWTTVEHSDGICKRHAEGLRHGATLVRDAQV